MDLGAGHPFHCGFWVAFPDACPTIHVRSPSCLGGIFDPPIGMWIAFVAGAFLITVFIGKVSEALRKREQASFFASAPALKT